MNVQHGQMAGGRIVADLEAHGQIAGDAIVGNGAQLVLHGQLAGTLTIEAGARAEIHGMVTDDVVNRGDVVISGWIVGRLVDLSGQAVLQPSARIGVR